MAVIVGAVRTPVGRFGGSLKDVAAYELGAVAIKGLLKKLSIAPKPTPESIEFYPEKLEKQNRARVSYDYDGVEVEIERL